MGGSGWRWKGDSVYFYKLPSCQGWGEDCPGHQAGGMCQCLYKSVMILPPGPSVCKKCEETLLREAAGEIKGKNVKGS